MQNLRNKITNALDNECGGPNVETIVGIGVALVVAVALYKLAKAMYDWINDSSTTVTDLEKGTPEKVIG